MPFSFSTLKKATSKTYLPMIMVPGKSHAQKENTKLTGTPQLVTSLASGGLKMTMTMPSPFIDNMERTRLQNLSRV